MINEIKNYVSNLFLEAPATMQSIELREEITSNLIDKYTDLVKHGVDQEEAYRVAIAGVGNVEELISGLTNEKFFFESKEKTKTFGILMATGVGILIASFIPAIVASYTGFPEGLGVVLMFLMWAIGTGLIIYANITRRKYRKADDTVVEQFKEWSSKKDRKSSMEKAVSTALWLIATSIFIILLFTIGQPQIIWIIFLIAGALQGFISAVFSRKN